MDGAGGGGEHVYVDIDGIGEIDCLRGLGLTEASDPMVCQHGVAVGSTGEKRVVALRHRGG